MRLAFSICNVLSVSRSIWSLLIGVAVSCILAVTPSVAVQDEFDRLSDEEARQVQIAERFVSVLEKSPRRGTALERVYGHHVEFGSLDKFIEDLQTRVKENPADGTGWMLLGLFEAQRGQDADAVDAFAEAEKHLTEDALPAYYMGQSLILIGQPENAVAAFERGGEQRPAGAHLEALRVRLLG